MTGSRTLGDNSMRPSAFSAEPPARRRTPPFAAGPRSPFGVLRALAEIGQPVEPLRVELQEPQSLARICVRVVVRLARRVVRGAVAPRQPAGRYRGERSIRGHGVRLKRRDGQTLPRAPGPGIDSRSSNSVEKTGATYPSPSHLYSVQPELPWAGYGVERALPGLRTPATTRHADVQATLRNVQGPACERQRRSHKVCGYVGYAVLDIDDAGARLQTFLA